MNSYARFCGRVLGATALAGVAAVSSAAEPAPTEIDWRDQVIYFLMIDRFADGDPDNNDQGTGEYDPADPRKFSGGDLQGVQDHLDYIRGLGATAVWITPPVANQWWDPRAGFGGFHGYWARDFKAVDAHFGTIDDYRSLGRAMDESGLALVQDIVVNHVGNYHGYADPKTFDAEHPDRGFARWPDGQGQLAPAQAPFDQNDASKPADQKAAIYHFTPTIRSHEDLHQEWNWQLADLDDLNTEHRLVRRALRDSYGFWIREVGVDAFRVDTAFYVPPDYFRDFLFARDRKAPGVMRVAQQLDRPEFHVFGEGFGIDRPFEDTAARRIEGYVRDSKGRALLPGMINFPLYGSVLDVFARGQGTDVLAHRIDSMMRVHSAPHLMPTFVDNHDVDRFLAQGSEAGLRQALLSIFTLPGIPTIYYGTEQGFTRQRPAMFAGGIDSTGRDHFDSTAPLYRFIADLAALRRVHPVLSRGRPKVLVSSASAGALAYQMGEGQDALMMLMNTADRPRLLVAETTHAPGSRWVSRLTLDGRPVSVILDTASRVVLELPARSGVVLALEPDARSKVAVCRAIELNDGVADGNGDMQVSGRAGAGEEIKVLLDGDLSSASPVQADAEGQFSLLIRTDSMIDPERRHELRAYRPADGCVSARPDWSRYPVSGHRLSDGSSGRRYRPIRPGQVSADADYDARQGDLRSVAVSHSGDSRRIEIAMAALVRSWNPANGFDHVALTAFLEWPDQLGGSPVMPGQSAELPDQMRWHRRWRAHGWSNVLFAPEGADAEREGRPLDGGGRLSVDRARQVIQLDLPAQVLGHGGNWSGARLYLNTWDYDGGYRKLTPDGAGFSFSGGSNEPGEPLLLDELGPIRLTLPVSR
ncbi:MAG: hypothetical protein IPK97_17515 [Ahniella sp.]|nr:hypothetical protein [Ahniella sp.]